MKKWNKLLIELYGIETEEPQATRTLVILLIELYGIETGDGSCRMVSDVLLIELYGIETSEHGYKCSKALTFNRTIWN